MAQILISTASGPISIRTYKGVDGETMVSLQLDALSSLFMPLSEAERLHTELGGVLLAASRPEAAE